MHLISYQIIKHARSIFYVFVDLKIIHENMLLKVYVHGEIISFTMLSYNEENGKKVELRDLKCRNGAQNRNLHEKLSKTSHVEKF